MGLEKVYAYFHHYDKQTHQVISCKGNQPFIQDIIKFENQFEILLPIIICGFMKS